MIKTNFDNLEISPETLETISYKDTKILSNFLSDQGKILPRRLTKLNSKQQKRITKLIKRARIAALLPFILGKA